MVVVVVVVGGNGRAGNGGGNRAVGAKLFIPPSYSKFLKLKDDFYRLKKKRN